MSKIEYKVSESKVISLLRTVRRFSKHTGNEKSLPLLPTSQASEDASLARRQHHRADARAAIYRKQGEKISTWM